MTLHRVGWEAALETTNAASVTPHSFEHLAIRLSTIGELAIPEAILLKPGRLTDDEYRQMQERVEAGVQICSPLRSLRASLPVIRHHHEHVAGNGYPDRLAGDAIPLLAQIIAVVDAYDAMTTTRPYHQAMPVSRACEILSENVGPRWDPAIVACFLGLLAA